MNEPSKQNAPSPQDVWGLSLVEFEDEKLADWPEVLGDPAAFVAFDPPLVSLPLIEAPLRQAG